MRGLKDMPKAAIEDIRQLTDREVEAGTASLPLAIALGEVAKAMERIAERLDKAENKLGDVHDRVIKMEASASSDLAKENRVRIEAIERDIASWKNRMYAVGSMAVIFWAIFGDSVQYALQRVTGI